MVYFITGIDTGIGKTYVTGQLAAWLQRRGRRVITQKLVQTGNVGFSEDLQSHRAAMGAVEFPEDREGLTAPVILPYPCSPHLAAEMEGTQIDLERITRATRILNERYEVVLLEGAGGPAAPLRRGYWQLDYVADCGYRLILVSSGRLGSLNHTFLALEAAARREVPVAGIVYNDYPPADPRIGADARELMKEELVRFGFPPVLVEGEDDYRELFREVL